MRSLRSSHPEPIEYFRPRSTPQGPGGAFSLPQTIHRRREAMLHLNRPTLGRLPLTEASFSGGDM